MRRQNRDGGKMAERLTSAAKAAFAAISPGAGASVLAAVSVASGIMAFAAVAMPADITAFAAETGGTSSRVIEAGNSADTGGQSAMKNTTAGTAQAPSAQPAPNGLGIVLEDLDAAANTDQLVVVVGSGMDSSRGKVGYYTKSVDGAWSEQFIADGYCGHNGMSTDKREGDRRTPTGTYSFTQAFGSLEDPGSILPYKQLDEYDYWVDDPASAYYNQMVSTKTVKKDWNSAEHLIGVMPQYRYSLAVSYNTADRVPGKGSAIFLHGYHTWKTWTEGCIAIPEEDMRLLVQQLDADAQIVIMPTRPEAVKE